MTDFSGIWVESHLKVSQGIRNSYYPVGSLFSWTPVKEPKLGFEGNAMHCSWKDLLFCEVLLCDLGGAESGKEGPLLVLFCLARSFASREQIHLKITGDLFNEMFCW